MLVAVYYWYGMELACRTQLSSASFTSPVVDRDRLKPGHWLGVRTMSFFRCFIAVGWMTGKSHQTYGNYVTFPKHLHYFLFNVGFLYEPALAGT